jgi:hypothetical protein
MQRAVFTLSPGEAKPGGSGLFWQPPLASADSIAMPPAAAEPMNRRTTLLERFIAASVHGWISIAACDKAGGSVFQSVRGCSNNGALERTTPFLWPAGAAFNPATHPPLETCIAKACANEPKPPRVTWPVAASELAPPDWPDDASPPKELCCDEDPPPQ